jgi:hypothetical protein
MTIDIDHLTIEQLEALNHRVIERMKFLDTVHAHKAMMAFNIGAKVSFDSPKDGRQLGTLVKFNRKTVTVITDKGQRWNIPPFLLAAVKDAKPTQIFEYAEKKKLK